MMAIAGAIPTAALINAACLPVTGNRILGRDFALADPRFSVLPASLTIGFAPAPGTRRTFASSELQRIARANGIPVRNFDDICFELPMIHPSEAEVTVAMRRALPANATLRIVEMAGFDVPAGVLEFPLAGLETPGPLNHGVQLWRGTVTYAETRRLTFWARVEISVPFLAVVPDKDLPQGVPIEAGSLRVEARTGPLEHDKAATRIAEVQGRLPRRAVKAGSAIPLAILADAPTVRKGDPVTVEVESGRARLLFEAVAEASACDGEIVALRNPASGKTFKARLEAGSTALLVIAGRFGQ